MTDAAEKAEIEFRDRFSVRTKMLAVGLAVTVATAGTGWISYRAERDTAERGLFLYDHVLQSLNYARAAQRDFALLRNLGRVAQQQRGERIAGDMLEELARDAGAADPVAAVGLLVRETIENLRVAAERQLPPDLTRRAQELMQRVERFERPVLMQMERAQVVADGEMLVSMAALAEDLELFVQDLAAEGFRVREEMGLQAERSAWMIAAAVVAAVLVAVFASLFFGETVARRVEAAARYSDRVASGELDRGLSITGATELASLMRSLDHMREAIRRQIGEIEGLRQRADHLVDAMFPRSIAARLRSGEERIADARVEATIVFLDLVGFTELSRRFGAAHLVETLDAIFHQLDETAKRHAIDKIKTLGDAYLAAAGVTGDTRPDDVARCAAFALEARRIIRAKGDDLGYPLDVRVGIHNGPVVAGILGSDRLFFDVWGDSVNLASRLQTAAQPGQICVSEAAFWRLRNSFALTALGAIDLKGIGPTTAFVLDGPLEE